MYRLILWDIDATILSTDGLSGQAMRAAMRTVFGATPDHPRPFYSGKTDRQIIRESYPHLDAAAVQRSLPTFREAYVATFEAMRSELVLRTHAKPGILELIPSLHGVLLQAPLTGNIAAIAQRKLDLLHLLPYLNMNAGAYGDDHDERVALLPIAARRAAHVLGRPFRGCDIIVVGDTPHDIRCGKAGGARTVAVATGPYSVEELRAHNPDLVFADLSDVVAVRAAILAEDAEPISDAAQH